MKTTANFITLFVFLLTSAVVLGGLLACNSSLQMTDEDFSELIRFENTIHEPGFETQKNCISVLADKNMKVLTIAEVGKIKSNNERLSTACDSYINKHAKLASRLMQYTDRMGVSVNWDTNEAEQVIADRMQNHQETFDEAVTFLMNESYTDFLHYFEKQKNTLQQENIVKTVHQEIKENANQQQEVYYASVVNQ